MEICSAESSDCLLLQPAAVQGGSVQKRQDTQLRRCYIPDEVLSRGRQYELPAESIRHLHTLRMQPGDGIELVNGRGVLGTGVISVLNKRDGVVRLIWICCGIDPCCAIPIVLTVCNRGLRTSLFLLWHQVVELCPPVLIFCFNFHCSCTRTRPGTWESCMASGWKRPA
jgi:hypothetical protein